MHRILGSSDFLWFHTSFVPSQLRRVKPSNTVSAPQLGVPALSLGSAPSLSLWQLYHRPFSWAQTLEAAWGKACLAFPYMGGFLSVSLWGMDVVGEHRPRANLL